MFRTTDLSLLSASSTLAQFEKHFDNMCYDAPELIKRLDKAHHEARQTYQQKSTYFNRSDHWVDREGLEVGFPIYVSILGEIINQISDYEEELSYTDDEEEENHILDSLFAAKEMYIRIANLMETLETNRVQATRYGVTPKSYLRLVSEHKGAVPVKTLDGSLPLRAGNVYIAPANTPLSAPSSNSATTLWTKLGTI